MHSNKNNFWPSIRSLLAGLLAGIVPTLLTDIILHATGLFPPIGQPMSNTLFLLATAYRILFSILSGYIAARLAPNRPMGHAMILGLIGLIVCTVGLLATWNRPDLGPRWYPLSLVVTALPCAWLGGFLHRISGKASHLGPTGNANAT